MQNFDLLVIDPQNDFLDIPGAALPVLGADADMRRLADWLMQHAQQVQSLTVTLDSHASMGIERTSFWLNADGSAVAPFTILTEADVRAGRVKPRHAQRLMAALSYMQALERSGPRRLVVWPVHCVLGTWGHNVHAQLAASVAHWELVTGMPCEKVIKGQHPMTEQYSAFRAEVVVPEDARTELNQALLRRLGSASHREDPGQNRGWLLVAGEALSHCVAASVQDMIAYLPPERLARTVLLTDCMSPVPGFEADGHAFLTQARAAGIRTMSLEELGEIG